MDSVSDFVVSFNFVVKSLLFVVDQQISIFYLTFLQMNIICICLKFNKLNDLTILSYGNPLNS